jgi:uncharacterized membrane protein YcgQ (UPF0703/DUF1980 family)
MSQANSKNICSLKDRLFVQQVNDININPQNYKDKVIQIEGFFAKYKDGKNVERYSVYRRTAGCCGFDGSVGFEFVYKKGKLNFKEDDWIYVEAHIAKSKNEVYDYDYIYLDAISVVQKDKGKAKEFVN